MARTRVASDAEKHVADRKLVRACVQGDQDAWGTLIRRHRRLIYSIPLKLGLDPADADEIFQQVAVKLLERLGDLRDAVSLPAWLAVTTRRECYGFVGRRKPSVPVEEGAGELAADVEDPGGGLHRVACEHALQLALEQLDPSCCELLHGLYLEDPTPSYETLARRLGRPVGSLGPTRARCLKKLRRLYEALGGPEP